MTELERFLDAVRTHHDLDPAEWHRGMLTPPGLPRTDRCEFCGVLWAEEAREAGDPLADYYGPCDVRSEAGVMRLHCYLRPGAVPASGYVDNRYNVRIHDISGQPVTLCLPGSEPLPMQAGDISLRVNEPIGWSIEQPRRPSYTEDEFRQLSFGEWR